MVEYQRINLMMKRIDKQTRVRRVNCKLGTQSPGNCLLGPYVPFGAVRPGPDTILETARGSTSGYVPGEPIRHFSQIHVSGTGGGGRYGNLAIMPMEQSHGSCAPAQQADQSRAWPGYYDVTLADSGSRVEITSTANCAAYRIQFGDQERSLLFDYAAHLLMGGEVVDGFIEPVGDTRMEGQVCLTGGWGHPHPYTFYFVVAFGCDWDSYESYPLSASLGSEVSNRGKVRFDFKRSDAVVEVTIAVSRSSMEDARRSLLEEPRGGFDAVCQRAETSWQEALGDFDLEGETEHMRMFDSMLHRLYTMPSALNLNSDLERWSTGVRPYDDFFCLWDSCRNANSFFHLFRPDLSSDFAACLVDIAKHRGWLPDAWISQHHGFIQGGCSADLVLSEAVRKGIGGFDTALALSAIRKNAEVDSPNPDFYGRYTVGYRTLGHVTPDETVGCVSRQIEYSYHDWCTARLAEHLGETDVAAHYDREAEKIWNLWHPERLGFYPKDVNGDWLPDFDQRVPYISPEEGHYSCDPYFFEGTGLEWAFSALHILPELIERWGGRDAFIERLDRFFESDMFSWKEILLHTPFLYHYAGRPDKSATAVREQMKRYSNVPKGIPDNEDMGSHTAFWLFASLGLYPVMGQCLYLITPPLFERSQMHVAAPGALLTITREGPADGYITEAYWKGQPYAKAWIGHDDLAEGGELHLILKEVPGQWGEGDLPPVC